MSITITDINELEMFFETQKANIPKEPVYLGKGVTVSTPETMVKSHLAILKATKNLKSKYMQPYFDRLIKLKNKITHARS